MNRSCFLISLAGFLLFLSASRSLSAPSPNVILILTDDQGYGDMSCHGNPWLKTPNLDRLHAQGISFEDFHVDPVCTPTRAALLTGRYCSRVGAWTVTQGRQLLNPDEITMADIFSRSGYHTAMFGKWHLGDPYPYSPRFRGFQEVLCHKAGGVDEIGNPFHNDFFDDIYYHNGKPLQCHGYCTEVFFNAAMSHIRRLRRDDPDHPFFIYMPFNAMHSPYRVPEKYAAPFRQLNMPPQQAQFFGMIENFDENLGRFRTFLKEMDLEKNTLLICLGDNGTAQGTGNLPGQLRFNAGMRGKKGSVYEGGHRMACAAYWPGRLEGGRKISQLTCHRDWLPTLMDLCALTKPQNLTCDGISMVPLFNDNNAAWPDRILFVDRQPGQPEPTPKKHPFAVLTTDWRLVNNELYQIRLDPAQQHNVAASHPDIVRRLRSAYDQWLQNLTRTRTDNSCFYLGADQESPLTFTVRDWFPTRGFLIWQQPSLADDTLQINGFWKLQVTRPGRYQISLARYPADAPKPIGACKAKIQLGQTIIEKNVNPADTTVDFELALDAGPTRLQTWLTDAKTQQQRGAYFVTCTRIDTKNLP